MHGVTFQLETPIRLSHDPANILLLQEFTHNDAPYEVEESQCPAGTAKSYPGRYRLQDYEEEPYAYEE